jgi:hypothetical protein
MVYLWWSVSLNVPALDASVAPSSSHDIVSSCLDLLILASVLVVVLPHRRRRRSPPSFLLPPPMSRPLFQVRYRISTPSILEEKSQNVLGSERTPVSLVWGAHALQSC